MVVKRSAIVGLFLTCMFGAQTKFEVASIKPANPSAPRGGRFASPPIN
jgi:hypothetical protein